jgi:NADH-quinone oxidoreductase subunit N
MESSFFDSSIFMIAREQWNSLAPFLVLFVGIFLATVLAAYRFGDRAQRALLAIIYSVGIYVCLTKWNEPTQMLFGTSLEVGPVLKIFASIIFLCGLLCAFLVSTEKEDPHSEWSLLMLIASLGMISLIGARNWISFFVSLETLSIPSYVLTAMYTRKSYSLEAGLKYLLMGSFASAFFLLGIATIYGLCGAFDYESLQGVLLDLSSQEKLLVSVATVILLSSFAFKIALIPFHMWAPDVYQGAPTGVAAFLGSTTKIALFVAVLMSFSRSGFYNLLLTKQFFTLFGSLSILVGSFLAISQRGLKRMLAYSGIVHVGYVSLMLSHGESAIGSIAFYLTIYALSFIGAFACIESLMKELKHDHRDISIEHLDQAAKTASPLTIVSLCFFMFSLAGIPPLPGFFTKYTVLKDLYTGGDFLSFALVLVGSFLGLAYYLRALIPLAFHDKISTEGISTKPEKRGYRLGWLAFAVLLLTVAAMGSAQFFSEWVLVGATSAR